MPTSSGRQVGFPRYKNRVGGARRRMADGVAPDAESKGGTEREAMCVIFLTVGLSVACTIRTFRE